MRRLSLFLLAITPTWMLGQPTRITSERSCSACTIEFTRVTTLDDDRIAGEPVSMARGRDGTIYLVDGRTRLYIFGSDGRFVRQLGRAGAGPGEFQDVVGIFVGSDDGVHVIDNRLGRHSTFSKDGALVGSVPYPAEGPAPGSVILLASNGVIVNRRNAEALQEVDAQGKVMKQFGIEAQPSQGRGWHHLRYLFERTNGELWSMKPFEYSITLFSAQRTELKQFARVADWFKPVGPNDTPSGGYDGRPATPIARAIREDAQHLVWTVTNVPAPGWKPPPNWKHDDPEGPAHERYNSMIEVFDPASGRLVSSRQVPEVIYYGMTDGHVGSYRLDADGAPVVEVWRVRLNRAR